MWQMPTGGEPARVLTAESNPVTNYAVSPDGRQIAYVRGRRGGVPFSLRFQHDGTIEGGASRFSVLAPATVP